MEEEILYTPEELAIKLKLSKYTVYEMIKRGDIQAHHIGRSIRVSQSQLDVYLMKTKKADNIYPCHILQEGSSTYALIDHVKISISTELTGDAKIHIRPEDIILSAGTFECSARNRHKGIVENITVDNDTAKILLNIGIPLFVLITKQSMIEMGIKKGTELYAIFKTMSVTVIK